MSEGNSRRLNKVFPLWHSELRIPHCSSCGGGHSYGSDSILGPVNSECQGCSQNRQKKKKKFDLSDLGKRVRLFLTRCSAAFRRLTHTFSAVNTHFCAFAQGREIAFILAAQKNNQEPALFHPSTPYPLSWLCTSKISFSSLSYGVPLGASEEDRLCFFFFFFDV